MADDFDAEPAEGDREPGREERTSVLPALAEMHRRAGRLEEAEQVARRGLEFDPAQSGARVVLALALIQRGRPEAAREALEPLADALLARHGMAGSGRPRRAAAPAAPAAEPGLSEDELERAFAAARPERERMIDADDIAERAIRQADLEVEDDAAAEPAAFATHTVADLLERQGDAEGARQIRAALDTRGRDSQRRKVLGELERWLLNLQRPRA